MNDWVVGSYWWEGGLVGVTRLGEEDFRSGMGSFMVRVMVLSGFRGMVS